MTALLRRLTRRTPRQPCVALDPLLALLAAFEANAWDWHGRGLEAEAQVSWHYASRLRTAIAAAPTP